MGKKGPKRHLKSRQSPGFWATHRKKNTWTGKPRPGPHKIGTSIPMNIILRDLLKYATTSKEAKRLIKDNKLIVDGKARLDERFPLGLMDVLQLPDSDEAFRVLPDHKSRLRLLQISKEESGFKLCQIKGKTSISGNRTQLNLHDGKNIHITDEADVYKVNDVIKIRVPDQEILDHLEFKERMQCIIIGGRSQGSVGMIIGIGPEPGWKKTVTIITSEGIDIRTLAKYVFIIGHNESMISLKEDEE
jgi:small subunit ribosomal protein S4e